MLETTFVKVCDLHPLTFPKIDKARRFSKIIASAAQATAFVCIIHPFLDRTITDIRSFILILVYILYIIMSPINFLYIFNSNLESVNFYLLQDSDEPWEPIKTTKSMFFYLVGGSIVMYYVSLVRNVSSWSLLTSFIVAGEVFAMYQLASLKFMTYKRLRWIWDEIRKGENILGFLPAVRKLSNINGRINQVYSLKSSVVLVYNFGPYIMSLTAFWEVYGLHKHTDTWEERDPFLAAFTTCQIAFLLVFLGYSTKKYAEMIDAWEMEIDREISTSDGSLRYRTQLDVFILELIQTPSELSAFRLFTIDNSAIVSVFGFTINVMMVFIQFLK